MKEKILYWALVLFTIYIILEIVCKIFGGSLGFEELVVGLLIANLGFSFKLHKEFSEHVGWHKGKSS